MHGDPSGRLPDAPNSGRGRNVAGRHLGAAAEEMLLHLLGQPLAGPDIGERKAILVDEHRLVLEPRLPGFLRHALVDALPEGTGIGREVDISGILSDSGVFFENR